MFEEFESSSLSPHDHFERGNQLDEANIKIRTDQRDFVNDILFDVYSDFEKSLEHASTHSEEKLNKSKYTMKCFKISQCIFRVYVKV